MRKTVEVRRRQVLAVLFSGLLVGVVGCGGGVDDQPTAMPASEEEFKQAQAEQEAIHEMENAGAPAP